MVFVIIIIKFILLIHDTCYYLIPLRTQCPLDAALLPQRAIKITRMLWMTPCIAGLNHFNSDRQKNLNRDALIAEIVLRKSFY